MSARQCSNLDAVIGLTPRREGKVALFRFVRKAAIPEGRWGAAWRRLVTGVGRSARRWRRGSDVGWIWPVREGANRRLRE